MAGALDPLGLLSPPYNKDVDFLHPSKDVSDAVNPCETPPLSSLDPPEPSNRPGVESPIPSVGPIDPALQVFTEDMDKTMPLLHNFAQWPPETTEHNAVVGSMPQAKRAASDFFYGNDDYGDAHCGVGVVNNHGKRRESRQSSSSNDSHSRTEGSKGGKHKEKNRLAASKSRQKKKKENENLEAQSKLLEDEQAKLKATADLLQSEVLSLKNEILKHGLCTNCEQIQKYILESANRLVYER
ncbi:hypothetical protein F4775DRAFT_329866 [Biscogniauxia sp. FL1348]|nr:hypothetical protein F4775DRAFT_329866 [Biscogniauxia sp. FL1348]